MANWSIGLSRAAFEEALGSCRERVQGGRLLIEHYTTRQGLTQRFTRQRFTRVETRRALIQWIGKKQRGIDES